MSEVTYKYMCPYCREQFNAPINFVQHLKSKECRKPVHINQQNPQNKSINQPHQPQQPQQLPKKGCNCGKK